MAQQDPTLMNATPSKKALLDSINTQIKAQTANKYGYSPYQSVGSLPAQEQDAILGDIANQITLQGKLTIGKGDLKQLPVFNAPTISARKPSFLEGLADIGANLGEGILQGATGRATDYYGNDLHDTFGIAGNPNNQWVRNITAIPTGLAVGAGLTLANPLLGAGWFGATSANQAVEGNQQAELGALAEGNIAQAQQLKGLRGVSAGLAGLAGGATSFLPATLGRGLLNKTLTGAGLGYTQDAINEKALEYATTGTATAGLPSVGLGTVFGAGFPLAGAGLKKLAGKRAKITEAQSQKQAVEALQNEADNAPLPSQRNRARATLRRINTELPVQQPISTRKPFKTAIETPQAKPVAQKPVAVVPVKKKIKPPFQLPTKVVGGFKKKVVNPAEVPQNIPDNVPVSAEVAKPAVVDVSKTETTTGKKTRTDVLKASLERKEAKLNDLFENQFSHWKKTNGQPMNDKRNGASHFKKSDKNDDAIRSQLAEIEKTKKAIEKEAVKVEQSERVKNSLPSSIVELLDSGKITQWRKFPDTFFVKGVDKGRFQYKDGVLSNRYYRDIPTQEQKAIFKDLYNSLNGKIEQSKTEAPTTKEGLATKPNSAKTAPVETTPAPKGKKGKLEPIKPNVVETRPKALKLNHDGVDFWVQKKWMRADGTLTPSGVKSFDEARTKKQFFDSPEGKQAIENKQKRIDGAIQWALDKTIEDPSKNGVFKTSGASKIGETLAKLAESKGDFSFENMRKHHYLTGETATHTWELEHSKGYNPDASYDDVGSVTLRFKEKPPDTAVDAKAVEPQTEKKLKDKVTKDVKGFASELKGAVKNGKISEDEAKNILYNLDDEAKQQIVDEIGCHCHE